MEGTCPVLRIPASGGSSGLWLFLSLGNGQETLVLHLVWGANQGSDFWSWGKSIVASDLDLLSVQSQLAREIEAGRSKIGDGVWLPRPS